MNGFQGGPSMIPWSNAGNSVQRTRPHLPNLPAAACGAIVPAPIPAEPRETNRNGPNLARFANMIRSARVRTAARGR